MVPCVVDALHVLKFSQVPVKKGQNLAKHIYQEVQNITVHVGIGEVLFLHPLFGDLCE